MCDKIDLTAKSGDWRWAGAMGYAGLWVRGSRWNPEHRMTFALDADARPRWINDQGIVMQAPGPYQERWELWEEPKPVEPERVRWTVALMGHECLVASGIAAGEIARLLPWQVTRGYRFFCWVYRLPDGREVVRAASACPIYWSAHAQNVYDYPDSLHDAIPVWPSKVEMIRVEA
jgi:hypothetical protein